MRATTALLVALLTGTAAQAQDSPALDERLVTVPLSRGSELNVVVSRQAGTEPTVAVLLFPGYPGVMRIREENGGIAYELKGNFLIRARRHLINDRIFTVMVDCPKDQWRNCDDRYRTSDQHAQDVADVANRLRQDFKAQSVYVMGTSYGTVSSSFLAQKMGPALNGAIHTATFTDPGTGGRKAHGLPMWDFDWKATKTDQLFVHHKDDDCPLTRYGSVVSRKGAIPLITVQGSQNARGDACEAYSTHGFAGREAATMHAVADWISTRKVAELVGEPAAQE
ncbi:MAG TPA: hypothetical protein VFF03_13225 [Rhodocyclaceae bacterium]|nr:hypothetical protein [Rhodocyclaceae bacterium]